MIRSATSSHGTTSSAAVGIGARDAQMSCAEQRDERGVCRVAVDPSRERAATACRDNARAQERERNIASSLDSSVSARHFVNVYVFG